MEYCVLFSSRAESNAAQNRKVTDYYPIRQEFQKKQKGKGRGVFAVRYFKKGKFVIEYHGDLMHLADAKERGALYAQDPGTGCYMYYFKSTRLGRLLNHSKTGNCQTKLHDIDGITHLILVASRETESEEELLYDYGDRSKESISAYTLLKY
uniref:Lysine methyltransferase 5Ab n=1 Tax=Oncorhynchus mykiss TaxID=8022 RepID=A0A8C7VJD2_ONCMY